MIINMKRSLLALSLFSFLKLAQSDYSNSDQEIIFRDGRSTSSKDSHRSSRNKFDSVPELREVPIENRRSSQHRDDNDGDDAQEKSSDRSSRRKKSERRRVDYDNVDDSHSRSHSHSHGYSESENVNPNYSESGLISCCSSGKVIALTFDDGPDEYTNELLQVLRSENVRATFFVVGQQLEDEERCQLAGKARHQGHLIASHTYSHRDLTQLSDYDFESEMQKTASLIRKCTGKSPSYMRPPMGAYNYYAINKLQDMGYKVVMWNMDPEDWLVPVTADRIDNMLSSTDKNEPERRSKILLLHDIKASTVQNVGEIIRTLRSYGYSFVTLDQCN